MPPVRRFYANNAPTQQISAQITSSATTLTAPSFTGWPTQFPFFATLELGTANEEIVSVTGITGTTATIVRAQDGSTAITHLAGATFDCTVVRQDLDEANAHTSASAGVHGISGSVVGTSDVQTLTNKTLASPTVTGTENGASLTLSGTLGVTGATTVAAITASGAVTANAAGTGLAVANNATIGGTMTVTGAHQAASYTASSGSVSGLIAPKSFTTAALAGTQPVGTIVYLSAPAVPFSPGLFQSNGSGGWFPIAGNVAVVAQLRQTTAQSVPTAAFTALTWQAADYDTGNGLSAGVWTCPVTGVYRISGSVEFAANATGRRLAKIQVNNVDVNGSQHEYSAFTTGSAVANTLAVPAIRAAVSAGQTVNLLTFQNSGAALSTLVTAPNESYLLIEQVG